MRKWRITGMLLPALFCCCICFAQNSIAPQQVYSSDFVIDDLPRTISFYMPAGYNDKSTPALIVMLHAQDEQANGFIKTYQQVIHPLADSLHAVVLYPDAVNGHWHSALDTPGKNEVNDVGFINIMITYFVQQYGCNAAEVFICGFGEGGAMAETLACRLNIPVRAIAAFKPGNSAPVCAIPAGIAVLQNQPFTTPATKSVYRAAIISAINFFKTHITP